MITVDFGCGRHFRAAQYVKPYVVYTVHRSDGSCGVYKYVAVLGGETVERGDYINPKGIFQYVGWKKLAGADGFPIDVRVVKALK
jgi:diaminopimelate decarboxylase